VFQHVLLNALDLSASGKEVKIIFEGASVKLVPMFENEHHPLYEQAKRGGLIAGVCLPARRSWGLRTEQFVRSGDARRHVRACRDEAHIEAGYSVVSM
jgi:hypothetical protein